ncbi:oxidoreductase [Neorhizobium sp. P12A]|uniref:2Fe-2S iron-sulfur cluster-binding protein n=1 Tax=Neorhizobium sp. P12A TaxID=2268027 RepID=UPI0011EE0DEF|nr:2Fe-2S iron-sulfur cluster-binding protein [Neorhizobium sp. P12A]KAA0698024.1 oxidoreductase [Neorhizobium sp. P12A]
MTVIMLKGTDVSWSCSDGDTIMRSALRAGLGFPYECNVGSCGNCRFDLLEGEVEDLRTDPPGLSDRDRERGRRLGCQARAMSDCVVKLRLMPQYESRFAPVRQAATLVAMRDITHDIREFRFRLEKPVRFLSGQYALLALPGVDGARAYSMANTGDNENEWHFQVRRVPNGAATTKLFEGLASGDRIEIDGPYGMAYLREDSLRDIICLAGGSGLSPMISITRAAAMSPELKGRRVDFIYGGRAARDICGREMLEELPGFGSTIYYHPVVSGAPEGDDGWDGYRGFVHEIAAELFGKRLPECEIYFAGPPAMGQAIQKMLLDLGVPSAQVHFDQFY